MSVSRLEFGTMSARLWDTALTLNQLLPVDHFSGLVSWLYEGWFLGLINDNEYFDLEARAYTR